MEPAIAKLDSALSAAEPLILPPYKGSTPRGGFGATFRRVVRVKRATPHPFEIEPPNERKRVYRPDEAITFGLIPISRAIAYLPYFIYTFDEIGRTGIGKRLIPGEKDSYLLIYGRPLAVPPDISRPDPTGDTGCLKRESDNSTGVPLRSLSQG